MELRLGAVRVDIVARNSDPAVPATRTADPGRVGRHGLEIIKAVFEEPFIEQGPVGKRITARPTPADASTPTWKRNATTASGTFPKRPSRLSPVPALVPTPVPMAASSPSSSRRPPPAHRPGATRSCARHVAPSRNLALRQPSGPFTVSCAGVGVGL